MWLHCLISLIQHRTKTVAFTDMTSINGTAKTLVTEFQERLKPLESLGDGKPGSSLVVALQDVTEETFVSWFSFQYGLICIKHTGLTSTQGMQRGELIVYPEVHSVGVFVGLKNLKNQLDALDVCRLVADQIVTFIPSSALDHPRLVSQSDVQTSQTCRCPIYRLDFEIESNYLATQQDRGVAPPSATSLDLIIASFEFRDTVVKE